MANISTNVTNAAESTLSSPLAAGSTAIGVSDTSGFPAVPFYATIDPGNDAKREVVLVDSGKTATTLSLTGAGSRGQDGTSDAAHDSGAVIAVVPVAALWTDINDRVDAIGTPYAPGGTDVAVADGGTGASTASTARSNLGAAADADVVKLTGAQTVAGVKTFSSSPVVPAPTTDLQAATKKYVDDTAGSATSGATEVIAEEVLTSAASTITFASIPSTYRHLFLVLEGKSDEGTSIVSGLLRFNGDTAANYDYQQMQATGTSVSAASTTGATSITGWYLLGATVDGVSPTKIFIPNYANTDRYKAAELANVHRYGTGSSLRVSSFAGFWRDTSAVSSITLSPSAGDFIAGTVATLYGLAGE